MCRINVFYLCVSRAGVAPSEARVTPRVLQAETGLVSLGHSTSSDHIQQVVVTEGVHAVVMSEGVGENKKIWTNITENLKSQKLIIKKRPRMV